MGSQWLFRPHEGRCACLDVKKGARPFAFTFAVILAFLTHWPASVTGQCNTVEQAKLVAADGGPSDLFGVAVGISLDTVVVGAYGDDHLGGTDAGSADVYVRTGNVWSHQAVLTASDAQPFDNFGISVAIDGDTAVIGAYGDDHSGGVSAGSAYVFVRTNNLWTQQARLSALDAMPSDFFGVCVAIDGDTIIVGAYDDDIDLAVDQGSAYVFVRSGTTWSQQAMLTASDGMATELFGVSVGISGDTAVVGAYRNDPNNQADAGAAYVFTRSGSIWTEQAKLIASDAGAIDNFGYSVAVDGNTALVGAQFDDHAGGADAGSAYVFTRSGTTWGEQAKLTASDAAPFDNFGVSVALGSDAALIGAYSSDPAGMDAGSAYLYTLTGTTWSQAARFNATDGQAFDNLGRSVALNSDTAIAGAYGDDLPGENSAGSAYLFDALRFTLPGDLDGNQVADGRDIAVFTAVALGGDSDPAHVGRTDMDCSGTVDGEDVAQFVTVLLQS